MPPPSIQGKPFSGRASGKKGKRKNRKIKSGRRGVACAKRCAHGDTRYEKTPNATIDASSAICWQRQIRMRLFIFLVSLFSKYEKYKVCAGRPTSPKKNATPPAGTKRSPFFKVIVCQPNFALHFFSKLPKTSFSDLTDKESTFFAWVDR